jgi:hypothetical protein
MVLKETTGTALPLLYSPWCKLHARPRPSYLADVGQSCPLIFCAQYAVGHRDRTLWGGGIAATLDDTVCTPLAPVYHALAGVGRGMV